MAEGEERKGFSVTYEVWDEDSAEAGETDNQGFIVENVSLRDALEAVRGTRTNQVDGVESVNPSDSRVGNARWITITNGREFETGAQESRSIHLPEHLTPSSRQRIAKLLGVKVPEPSPEATGPRM